MGLIGYYRRFIPDFAKPLTALLKKNVDFNRRPEHQKSFETLRDKLCCEPLLQYPDFNKPFVVTTDASDFTLGAVLSQGPIGRDLPISYASRTLQSAEVNYSTTEKELLAIVFAVKHFRPYLYGHKFILVTDHRPLIWLNNLKDPVSRLARWRIKLSDHDYEIVYKKGIANSNADALSRNHPDLSKRHEQMTEIMQSEQRLSNDAQASAQPALETHEDDDDIMGDTEKEKDWNRDECDERTTSLEDAVANAFLAAGRLGTPQSLDKDEGCLSASESSPLTWLGNPQSLDNDEGRAGASESKSSGK